MKYIIFGLGNFGASLAEKLTIQGNEVIGVDRNMDKVDALKERISHTVCLDATDEFTVTGLPLKEADIIIVAIGEDQGANIMVTALLRTIHVKRLISRAINPLHEKVLQALGVDEIVHPEEETAERWAKKLCLNGLVDSFELADGYSIVEITVPESLVGKRLEEIQFRANYNLLVLTTLKRSEEHAQLGKSVNVIRVKGVAASNEQLDKGDILVVYGSDEDIAKFLKHSK